MYPQIRHYTIYTGEQRCSPAPFSPPPSPPKSEIWSTTKNDEPFSYNFTGVSVSSKPNTHKTHVHQPSTNYRAYSSGTSAVYSTCNHSDDFPQVSSAQHYLSYNSHTYNKINTTHETWEQQPTTTNDVEKQQMQINEPSENSNVPETAIKTLSRMSIDFMLDNPRDEACVNTPLATTDFKAELGKEIDRRVYAGRKRRCRKNPYPMRAPSKDAPGINLKVDVYTPVIKDPVAILRSNDTSAASSPTDSVTSQPLFGNQTTSSSQFSPSQSLVESNDESTEDGKPSVNLKIKDKSFAKNQQRPKARRSGAVKPERKRKGNSLARVMTDRGLLESIFNTDITSTDIKLVRIPPPPPMQHHELMAVIKELNIDHSVLDNYTIDIAWKGQPLNIAHLPHYKELHETEAKIVSILRLTPVQYLTGKHTLVSAARRYVQRSLPFKKSDAQKLLRIDVNKASKLWEFFRRIQWI